MKIISLLFKWLKFFISVVLHLGALGLVIYLLQPIGRWYLEQVPVRGVDFWLSGTYVSNILKNPRFLFNGWKDVWFCGMPYGLDYTFLYFYLMAFFAKYLGLMKGIQWFALAGLLTFSTFSYLLCYQLSKNRILSVILTLIAVFSPNYYQALVWAGGIPFWTSQAFFPIIIFLIIKYNQSNNLKWLLLASLAAGLGILGHPQSFQNFILPSTALLILFYYPSFKRITFKKRIINFLTFFGLMLLVSCSYIIDVLPRTVIGLIDNLFKEITKKPPENLSPEASASAALVKNWTRNQFGHIWSQDTSFLLWYFLAASAIFFLIAIIFRKRRLKALANLFPFLIIGIWPISLIYLFSRGIDILVVSGWYKVFWMVLPAIAALTAFLWGEANKMFQERKIFQAKGFVLLRKLGAVIVGLLLIGIGYYYLPEEREKLVLRLAEIDQFSSAYPERLNLQHNDSNLFELAKNLRPKLMTDDSLKYRLHAIDATFNLWWGALQDVPLSRGYVDPPLSIAERWGVFWLDAALSPGQKTNMSSLIDDWKTPEWVANNNARFLLDWHAIGFYEGDHTGVTRSNLASNIVSPEFVEDREKVMIQGGIIDRYNPKERWNEEGVQDLIFYKIKKELVSPILMATNASPVLHVGSNDGYDTLLRYLGMMNLGPRNIIIAKGPQYIDSLSYNDLKNFEAVILYYYDYRSYQKAWKLISNYVENGGKVFIDTGTEVKESNAVELPAILPIKSLVREDLGRDWQITFEKSKINEGIDFKKFSPLIYNDQAWNISHPRDKDDLRDNSEVILSNKEYPVVALKNVGKGKLIWSGLNLPYHIIRDYNPEEGKLLQNILNELVDLNGGEVEAKTDKISPQERTIELSGAKGVVLKEEAYPGWQAKINNKKTKIYKTGPTSPGFMYIRLPESFSGLVKFKYQGDFKQKIYTLISILTIIYILDYILGLKLITKIIKKSYKILRQKAGRWWDKEEGY